MERAEFLRDMITEYRKKIETYQAMITEWERELGLGATSASMSIAEPPGEQKKNGGPDPIWMVKDWQFYGKSQPEAVRMLLEMVKFPLTTSKILEGVERGGVKVGGKTDIARKQNLYTILNRSKDFVRIARDTWALPGWPGVPKKSVKDDDAPESAANSDSEVQK